MVSVYSLSVFLHVVGALGLFAGVGVEQVSLRALRRATTTAQVRDWAGQLASLRRRELPASLLLLGSGLHLVLTRWGHHAWIGLGLLGLLLIGALGGAVTARRARALVAATPVGDGPVSAALRTRLRDRALRASASVRAALALGIVFNMSVKPDTAGAIGAIVVALAAGGVLATRSDDGGAEARDEEPVAAAP